MSRRCCGRRCVGGLLAWAIASAAVAQPLWVRHGASAAQAQGFKLGLQCLAVTPAHVFAAGAEAAQTVVRLADRVGQVHHARVIAVDAGQDLALLLLQPPAAEAPTSCGGFPALNLSRLDEYQPDLLSEPATWFDLVASPAGGLDRFDVAVLPASVRTETSEFAVAPKSGPDEAVPTARNGGLVSGWNRKREAPVARFGRLPVAGNSGAILWVGRRDSGYFTEQRYDGDKLVYSLDQWGLANIAGMLLRVGVGRAELVDARAISDFVGQAVRPVDWRRLRVEAPGAVVSDRRRGQQADVQFSIDGGLLDAVSYEFDLGDDDKVLTAVEVLYDHSTIAPSALAPIPELAADDGRSPEVLVSVSQFRPKAGRDWRPSACSTHVWTPAGTPPTDLHGHRCTLEQQVIARGVRVTLRGMPGRWRLLRLVLER